ncbi:hypothetical protein [Mucilaginibacter sp. UR6-11]|uniref:hypothetical protein n=1 Tax=Mucilaginibacter sp. UR6-11 TaxID=1435644 RepID=UPI001E585DE1|nr:hypothetical protein [Mucilaginibacter sp. UR6-11]MCC8426583.1 hypothetical protein [Mucilaginibacter sp. UR6-11]
MIDGIVLSSNSIDLRQRIEASPLLSETLRNHTTIKTGENYTTAKYNDVEFTIFSSGRIQIRGSLHKYYNCISNNFIGKQKHNANDFNIADIKGVLVSLSASFGPEILNCKVDSIEFGLNVNTSCSARYFIEQNITLLKSGARLKNPIIENSIHGFNCGVKYIFCDYWLKVYDKGAMYNISETLLRCEYKALKMRVIKDAKLTTLSDISDKNALQVLFNNLIDIYGYLLIREQFNEKDFSANDLRLYDQGFNPDYWKGIDRQERKRKKKQFDKLYADHAKTNLKGEILNLLTTKFSELT